MFYIILKFLFKVALRIFFRRIEVQHKHLIPASGPLMIAANHPNTFMDPIAIAAFVKQEVYFIAKSTLFNTPFNKWLLQKLNLIPVYRREDGVVPATSNEQTFQQCFRFLQRKGTLLIFPEGNSYNERCLRPLKTGTARIALGVEAQAGFQAGLQLVPIGLNYSDPTRFRSNLFINVGAPIQVAAYAETYNQDPAKAIQELTNHLRERLEELLVTVNTPEEEELLERIRVIYSTNLAEELGLSKREEDKFVLTKAIADSIRYFSQHEPARVRRIGEQIHQYYLDLKKLGLEDRFMRMPRQNAGLFRDSLQTGLYLLLGLPLFSWGVLTNYIPYYIPAKIADRISEEEEFRAPIMMTAGIFTFTIYYALITWGFSFWNSNGWVLAAFILSLPVSGLFALHYSYRLRLTRGYLQFLIIFYRQSNLIYKIWQQRQAIITNLEEAKEIYQQHLVKANHGTSLEHFE